jgi:hypothetical protein
MNLGKLIKLARIRLRDKNPEKYLWDNDELIEFANSAVSEAAIRARLLQTQSILPVTAGLCDITLPYTVLQPQGALFLDHAGATAIAGSFSVGRWYKIVDLGTTLFRSIGALAATVGEVFLATGVGTGTGTALLCNESPLLPIAQDEYYNLRAYLSSSPTRPTHYMRGNNANVIRLYPTPLASGTIVVDNRRMPSEDDEMQGLSDEPVIPEEFHRDLVYWMLAEAYQVHDADKLDLNAAKRYEDLFDQRFGKKISAKAEMQGRRNITGSDIRPQKFGGGVNQSHNY